VKEIKEHCLSKKKGRKPSGAKESIGEGVKRRREKRRRRDVAE